MKGYETRPLANISEDGRATAETAALHVETAAPQPAQNRRWRPSRSQLIEWMAYGAVVLLAALLRFWGLGDRPLHHDESLHAYFSLQLMLNILSYHYDPLLHGPFQFHLMALVYKLAQLVGAPDNGVNTTTVRLLAATLGTALVGLPYLLRRSLGKVAAWLGALLLAVSPSLVYYSRFAREDIYMAFFTLLLVVAVVRYARERRPGWLVLASLALALSYATKEATFLSMAVFGSYGVGVLVWELGAKLEMRLPMQEQPGERPRWLPRTWAPLFLLLYACIAAIFAHFLFAWLHSLSFYITAHQQTSDAFVATLKDKTALLVPWLGVGLGLLVLGLLLREMFGGEPPEGRRGLARRVDLQRQPLLDSLVSMPWTHWFFAILVFWAIFLVLFTVLFTNIRAGIGDGIWGGLYYWIEQIAVARGGQPWYYYLLLIPLYEQIGVVFGLVGIVRCLWRPTRLRLLLVYWCVGNLVIYSWAAEKMPWLTIHITMPLMLLAGVGLEPAVQRLLRWGEQWWRRRRERVEEKQEESLALGVVGRGRKAGRGGLVGAGATVLAGLLLLIPTLQNVYEVTYVHAADAPHEMLIYVQTTTDVNTVMARITALDRKLYGGQHRLPIGVMNDAVWPFIWYLRDYPDACYNYPTDCPDAQDYPVIIAGGDNLYLAQSEYANTAVHSGGYLFHEYRMRTWWDEGYKPPPCVPSKANNNCEGQQTWGGVGPLLWLSYGDNPPPNAHFNPLLAAQRIWAWWWQRQPFGATDGSYDMGLFIKQGLGVTP